MKENVGTMTVTVKREGENLDQPSKVLVKSSDLIPESASGNILYKLYNVVLPIKYLY